MPEETDTGNVVDFVKVHSDEIAQHINEYSYLVADALYVIVLGMLAVFVLHKLVAKFLFRFMSNARLVLVVFGTLYVLVFVVTVLLVIKKMGFETKDLGAIAILTILIGAVLVYYLIPFLPRLPFKPGHMIETIGVMGTVESVSSFHTTLRKFDGTLAFLPNALVMASKILNYSYIPNRRIEMKLVISTGCDLEAVKARVLELAATEKQVLETPAPVLYAVHADAAGIEMMLYCWVENADFLRTRSDLWLQLVQLAREDSNITLAVPKQEIQLTEPGLKEGDR